MTPLVMALLSALGVLGLLLAALELFVERPSREGRPPSSFERRLGQLRRRMKRKQWLLLGASVLAGALLWAISGLPILLPVGAAAVVGLPYLLSPPVGGASIERLDALEAWTRSLSGLIVSGAGLEQALTVSLSSVHDSIRAEVTTLVARLNARWSTQDALGMFAEEMDDPTADLVVAHLQLSARQRGAGLAAALDDLAQIVFEEVKTRRQIEADREKPRANARIITLISAAVILLLLTQRTYIEPYGTLLGTLLLAVYLAAYVGCLIWMRRMSTGTATPRILVDGRGDS